MCTFVFPLAGQFLASVFRSLFLRHLRQSLLSTHHIKSLALPPFVCFTMGGGGGHGVQDGGLQLLEEKLLEQRLRHEQERHEREEKRHERELEQKLRLEQERHEREQERHEREEKRHKKKLDEEAGEVMFDHTTI